LLEERPVAVVRCILDSLAAGYARTIADAERLAGVPINVVHIVGGGSQNRLLCQLTANVTGKPVIAGPVEATALGNIMVQARATGRITGNLTALRDLVAAGTALERYVPVLAAADKSPLLHPVISYLPRAD
jgi:rhamnulokinase